MLKKLMNQLMLVGLFKSVGNKAAVGLGLSLLTAGIASTAYAYVDGFYVGGGVNYTWFTYDYDFIDTDFQRGTQDKNSNDATGNDAGGQVVAGYTWLLPVNNKYFVSLEGFANFHTIDANQSWNNTTTSGAVSSLNATVQNAYGLIVKPGVSITDNFNLFVEGGIAYSQLKDISYDRTFASGRTFITEYDNENLFGYRFGLGGQYVLTENFVAELSWALTYYDGFSQHGTTNASDTGEISAEGTPDLNAIRTNQVFLNLNYYFE